MKDNRDELNSGFLVLAASWTTIITPRACAATGKAISLSVVCCQHKNWQISGI